ncbi:ATP phosphoribosyltransferase regulatory subunit [Amylibacter sp. SFDW26]|uniref:ATP phosphoribosyltransferase regulatory subunit n=1 Tax=Amylibacter sp. SFDW26 TaxID=2652722 RepID=UPI001262404E|nr:ATP phosphoribosyltransferase regulatory subunit [Amylibacter sp. SFDW26]KAB7613734.1 ATP phosphoribosyltransferase regulatory subunit [Amylibacter sp. SFDW26]
MTPVAIKTLAGQLSNAFMNAGAVPVEAPALQPAEVLLDLYGEDIRGRAYVTDDPVNGEQMLRPDFTVPVVQMHMNGGAEPARYTYNGPVWRKQEPTIGRATEYLQVGYELFDRNDSSLSDAEVFSLFYNILRPYGLRTMTGDIGLLSAAIDGLSTTDRRKERLKRQIWRPMRFRQLLDWYSGKADNLPTRVALLDQVSGSDAEAVLNDAQPFLGVRSEAEVLARVASLQEDAATAPIPAKELAVVEELLALNGTAADALKTLRGVQDRLEGFSTAVDCLEMRLTALAASGIDIKSLPFEANFGLTSMEYYDGFVFGFFDGENVIASGGRYDALTQVLGQGRSIPAVGGVIRPDVLAAVGGGAS